MELPERVKLGFITYDILIVDEPLEDNRVGEIDYHEGLIKISKYLSKPMQKWTLYHELTHALLMKMGYKDADEVVLDERFVDAFGVVLGELVEDLTKK